MGFVSKNTLTLILLAYETEIRKAPLSDQSLQVSRCCAVLVLISKRMGLAGLSEIINIRGHKAMLIEWSPHCNAQGVSLLAPFSPNPPLSSLTIPSPFSLVCLSYKSLGDPPLALAFPTDSSKKTGLV